MKYLKLYIGSLIISFGVLLVTAAIVGSIGIKVPAEITGNMLFVWLGMGVILLPFARKIVRV